MKNKKTWLMLSCACIILGIFLNALGTMLGGTAGFYLDRNGVHTSRENDSNTAKVFQDSRELEAFDSLDLQIRYADILLIPSDRYAIDYRTTGFSEAPACRIENGTLSFYEDPAYSNPRIWFFYAGPDSRYVREPELGPYYVKIEYPGEHMFSTIEIRSESGDLKLPALQADTLDIRAEYGNVSLDGYTGQTLQLHMSSGDLSAGSVSADQSEFRNEYGTVWIRQASGGHLTAELSSGDFLADCLDLTEVSVQNEYGDVAVSLLGDPESYGYQLSTEYGCIRMDGQMLYNKNEDDGASYFTEGSGEKTVEASCENGDIIIALLSHSL